VGGARRVAGARGPGTRRIGFPGLGAPAARLAATTARARACHPVRHRHLAHGLVRRRLRLDRGLPRAGPRVPPHRPGRRGAGHRTGPCLPRAVPVRDWPGAAPRALGHWAVGHVGPDRPGSRPGHGRLPSRRSAGGAPTLAVGAARDLSPGRRSAARRRVHWPRRLGAGRSRAVLRPRRRRLPGPRAAGPLPGDLWHMVADPDAAGRRHRPAADLHTRRLPERSAHDLDRPGRTSGDGGRGGGGRPGRARAIQARVLGSRGRRGRGPRVTGSSPSGEARAGEVEHPLVRNRCSGPGGGSRGGRSCLFPGPK
jgi:hypothetical protein